MSTFGSTNSGIVLNNAGENPATIITGAYVTNTTTANSGDAIVGTSGTAWTVVNYGRVTGGGSDNFGLFLDSGGLIVNGAANATTALITGTDGVGIKNAAGTVVNYGTIQSNATGTLGGNAVYLGAGGLAENSGLLSAPNDGIDFRNIVGTAVNIGTIVTTGTGNAVLLEAGGTLLNSGTLVAASSNSTVFTEDGVGIVINAGIIQNSDSNAVHVATGRVVNEKGALIAGNGTGDGVTIGTPGSGQTYAGTGTVTNAGTIAHTGSGTSGVAVYLGAGGTVTNTGLISGARPGSASAGYPGAMQASNQPAAVTNLGTITNPDNGNGVNLLDGGVVTNGTGGTGFSTALIYGVHGGIYMGGTAGTPTPGATGTVINYGTIANNSTTSSAISLASGGVTGNIGLIATTRTGISIKNATGAIDNSGTIVSTAALLGTAGSGAYLGAGGFLRNETTGLVTAQRAAVSLAFDGTTTAGATVVNNGTLVGSDGITIGVGDSGSNTLINAGTLIGTTGVAINLSLAGTDAIVEDAGGIINGGIQNFQPGDTIDLAGLPFDPNGVVNLEPGDPLSVDYTLAVTADGTTDSIGLVNPIVAGDVFTLGTDGTGGTLISEGAGAAPYTPADPLMTNTAGALVFDQVTGGQINFTTIGGLGSEWEYDGSGYYLNGGTGNPGFLIRDDGSVNPGALYVGEVSNGQAQFVPVGGLGSEWQFEGSANFLGTGQSEFLIRNVGSVEPGALFLGQVTGTAAAGYSINFIPEGGLGLEWEFDGTGDFLGDGNQGFLIRNDGTDEPGALFVGEIANGTVDYTPIGGLGPEWQFEGTGDFLGDGRTDFLVWNTGTTEPGVMAIGEVDNGQTSFTTIGGIGPEWQFIGTGNYIDSNKTDFLLRSTGNGELAVASVSGSAGNATVTFTEVGGIGSEWTFHNTSPTLLS